MKKKTKRLLWGAGALAAGTAAVSAAVRGVSGALVRLALDRREPARLERARERLSGSQIEQELFQQSLEAAQRLENSGCERVEITSHDGLRLVGHWRKHPDARRVVVAMHGWRSSWAADFGLIADFLWQEGCSVLYAEQRAQNSSEGEYMTFGALERYDCLAWLHWVNEHGAAELPVYLAGVSMGASTVLMAAGLELPGNVRGIVADCGFTSPNEIWKHVAEKNLRIHYALHDTMIERMCRRRLQMDVADCSTLDALARCRVPVLFIHGEADSFVPVEMSYRNYDACAAPKRLFIVPGAEHGLSYWTDTAGYQSELRLFWHTYDDEGAAPEGGA